MFTIAIETLNGARVQKAENNLAHARLHVKQTMHETRNLGDRAQRFQRLRKKARDHPRLSQLLSETDSDPDALAQALTDVQQAEHELLEANKEAAKIALEPEQQYSLRCRLERVRAEMNSESVGWEQIARARTVHQEGSKWLKCTQFLSCLRICMEDALCCSLCLLVVTLECEVRQLMEDAVARGFSLTVLSYNIVSCNYTNRLVLVLSD